MVIKIVKLASQNPWWRQGDWHAGDRDLAGMGIRLERRMLEPGGDRTFVIRGIRRSGKTVFLKMMVDVLVRSGVDRRSIVYISCDRHSRNEIGGYIQELSLRQGRLFLLLDEITHMRDWNGFLKELHETREIWVMATGSDPVQMKERTERLPGRGVEGNELYFNPLSFREFVMGLASKRAGVAPGPLKDALDEAARMPDTAHPAEVPATDELYPFYDCLERLFYVYVLTGGFPNAISDYCLDGRVSDASYEMMVRLILGTVSKEGRSEATARDLMERMLRGMGSRMDFISIAENIGIHHGTVRDYLELLDGARVSLTLNCWDLARRTHAVRKQRKHVFQSPFIAAALDRYLNGGTWDDTLEFVDRSMEQLVEGIVQAHTVWSRERPIMNEQHAFAGYHYNTRECDLVLLRDGRFHGFEVKYGKLERGRYPFPVLYITKDSVAEDAVPASVFLFGLEKSPWCL